MRRKDKQITKQTTPRKETQMQPTKKNKTQVTIKQRAEKKT